MNERVEAMVSPRNSILIPRRFYLDDKSEEQENVPSIKEHGLKNLMKQINSLKKKIKRYEGEFEDNFGYRPSHSDKMSNRDIKRIVSELNKVRKEHKILKEGFVGTLLGGPKLLRDETVGANNNNNGEDALRANSMSEMVMEVERRLADKRFKYNRPEDMEDLTYEQLLDEKTAVQKALLHIENTFGRPVSKEDRSIVRPLYDKYRTLKRQLIRAGAVSIFFSVVYCIRLTVRDNNFYAFSLRIDSRTACQSLLLFWSTKPWTLHRQWEIQSIAIAGPVNPICLIGEFWTASTLRRRYRLTVTVSTAAVMAVAE